MLTTADPQRIDGELSLKAQRVGTFTDNMKLPIHRWFRYSQVF